MGRKEHAREQEEFHALASEVVDLYLHEEEWLDIYNVLQRLLEQDAEVAISTLAAFGASAVELLAERAGLTTQQALELVRERGYGGMHRVYQSEARQRKNEKDERKNLWRRPGPWGFPDDQ